ncbi:linear amide C-N hydrolase [Desulfopila sp. IMCC35008]|uniref:linear amide C-N hydrolase n=1 Tax=Desulfopila sp. IMCC35008 TaxID=2653858 RepID=UPI0013D6652D|nr:linear amide C-N hydrolase [Desulfopila sp. IMCC35008]
MISFKKKSIFCFFLLIFDSNLAPACTTFCLDITNRPVYGRNFDWRLGDGCIFINKRGVVKTTISYETDEVNNSLSWVSKYGSATFNLFGREFPMGGMNEAGLVVESMMLDETQYPPKDSRPEIMASQWIQYQLDNFSKVEDVISSGSKMRIQASKDSKLHFFICERSGICATIEFIEGELIYHTNERLPVKTLTNSTYTESLSYWRKGELPQSDKNKSIERFNRTANLVNEYDPLTLGQPIEYAFNILKKAEHDSLKTQWSIVYDIVGFTIYFRTYDNQKTRIFSLKSFDLSCSTPVKVMNTDSGQSGYIADKFIQYSYQANRNQIRNFYLKSYFSALPDHILDLFSGYPETTFCN